MTLSQKYNSDDQIKKLTIIIDITLHLWTDLLNDTEKLIVRKNLIGIIYLFILHSTYLYQKTATAHDVDYYHLHQLMVTIIDLIKNYKTREKKTQVIKLCQDVR